MPCKLCTPQVSWSRSFSVKIGCLANRDTERKKKKQTKKWIHKRNGEQMTRENIIMNRKKIYIYCERTKSKWRDSITNTLALTHAEIWPKAKRCDEWNEKKIDFIESVHRRNRTPREKCEVFWVYVERCERADCTLEKIIEFRSNDLTKYNFVVSLASRPSILLFGKTISSRDFATLTFKLFSD